MGTKSNLGSKYLVEKTPRESRDIGREVKSYLFILPDFLILSTARPELILTLDLFL